MIPPECGVYATPPNLFIGVDPEGPEPAQVNITFSNPTAYVEVIALDFYTGLFTYEPQLPDTLVLEPMSSINYSLNISAPVRTTYGQTTGHLTCQVKSINGTSLDDSVVRTWQLILNVRQYGAAIVDPPLETIELEPGRRYLIAVDVSNSGNFRDSFAMVLDQTELDLDGIGIVFETDPGNPEDGDFPIELDRNARITLEFWLEAPSAPGTYRATIGVLSWVDDWRDLGPFTAVGNISFEVVEPATIDWTPLGWSAPLAIILALTWIILLHRAYAPIPVRPRDSTQEE